MWTPLFDVDRTFAEMDTLGRRLDSLLGARGLDGRHGLRTLEGPVRDALVRSETGWRLTVDLPGVPKDAVALTAREGRLELEAERAMPVPDGFSPKYRERRAFRVRRGWNLPEDVDLDAVDAAFDDGVLTVHLARRPETTPRRIELS